MGKQDCCPKAGERGGVVRIARGTSRDHKNESSRQNVCVVAGDQC